MLSDVNENDRLDQGSDVLPAELRQRDGIEPGQEFEVERLDADE